mmetsp:Transcript_29499/g.94728  ORF Transcript_29499/g.94728 Transcript_29499/m.94728 type:complete len:428 (-) Transcript_29499:146-1429(-)
MEDELDAAPDAYRSLRILLSVLSILDLALEKLAKSKSESARDTVVITIEALRCGVKLYILAHERDIHVGYRVGDEAEPEAVAAAPMIRRREAAPAKAATATYCGGRSGRSFAVPEKFLKAAALRRGPAAAAVGVCKGDVEEDKARVSAKDTSQKPGEKSSVFEDSSEEEDDEEGLEVKDRPAPPIDADADFEGVWRTVELPEQFSESKPDAPEASRDASIWSVLGRFLSPGEAMESEGDGAADYGQGLLLLGEILFIIRPFLFAVIERVIIRRRLRKRGKGQGGPNTYGSWWLLAGSFAMDLLASRASSAALASKRVGLLEMGVRAIESEGEGSLQPGTPGRMQFEAELTAKMGKHARQEEELRRRKMLWLLYLLRSPLFQVLLEPASKRVDGVFQRVPGLRGLSSYALQMLHHVQQHHFYTSGSSV